MTHDDLLPCPFCGGDADINHDHTVEESHAYGCRSCGVWFDSYNAEDAPAAWNARSDQAIRDLQAEVARLREALQGVADYSTIPSKDFRKRHPEFAAAMRAEEKRYGLEFLPELALSRKARATLEDTP